MGRAPCCDKANVKRGPWSPEEDAVLRSYVERNGTGGNWIALPQKAGLKRCGKSCRLRWLNYLRPDIKHGGFTEEEDNTILTLYSNIGSRWSVIASRLPGRTDNDVKNYWNTKLKKRLMAAQTTINPTTSLAPPPPPHLIQTIKSEASNISDFSLPLGDEALHPSFGFSWETQRLLFSELAQFPFLELPGASGGMSKYVEDGSAASSSNTMDNSSNSSYADWCVNGAGADDWFMPKAGFRPTEFLGSYGSQERVGEVLAPCYSSILPNMRETAETNPQGLFYQGVTYS